MIILITGTPKKGAPNLGKLPLFGRHLTSCSLVAEAGELLSPTRGMLPDHLGLDDLRGSRDKGPLETLGIHWDEKGVNVDP